MSIAICEQFDKAFVEKSIDFLKKPDKITKEIAYSLIKSGGGNGPMKPGNLAKSKGAKSGGKREMRIRYLSTSSPSVCDFFVRICL